MLHDTIPHSVAAMDEQAAVVLVVDDDRGVADMFATWLSDDYVTRTAYSGREALELLDEIPDVVLLDRNIPDLSGRELLRAIRGREFSCSVAMVTAVEPGLDIIDMGFDDYLVKPVFASDLRDVVRRLLRRRELDRMVQELFALASKRALLETELDDSELVASGKYTDLVEEVELLRSAVDDELVEAAKAEYESLFYDVRSGPAPA